MDDPRVTPARGDLAAKYLEGKVKAARFVEGQEFEIVEALAPMREAPAADARLLTQALKGERVTIYDRNGEGFAWGQLNSDGYVGWIPDAALGKPAARRHTRWRPCGPCAPAASIKNSRLDTLSMGATVTSRKMARCGDTRRLVPAAPACRRHRGHGEGSWRRRALSAPYLWGGKAVLGSIAPVSWNSVNAAGTGCPRDSDMQQDGLGRTLSAAETKKLRRGDLIFWKGHVAIARDADTIVHANAHHMATVIERTAEAIARIKAAGSEVAAIKRL
jgi:hypothetical protein